MEPTGRNRQSEKWQSPMALRKFREAGLGVGEPTGWPKPPVGKMAKSDGIAGVQRPENLAIIRL